METMYTPTKMTIRVPNINLIICKLSLLNVIWRPPSLNELIPIMSYTELTKLG